jgi:hypothetical protein
LPVTANVVLLNFCYDIGVKVESSHLLFMVIFLLAPDLKRLGSVVLGRAVDALPPPVTAPSNIRWVGTAARLTFVVSLIGTDVLANMDVVDRLRSRHPLYGAYEVESESTPKNVRLAMIDEINVFAIQTIDGSLHRFRIDRSSSSESLTLRPFRDPTSTCRIAYRRLGTDRLIVEGTIEGEPVELYLRKVPMPTFVLKTRGFHWVNAGYPFDP